MEKRTVEEVKRDITLHFAGICSLNGKGYSVKQKKIIEDYMLNRDDPIFYKKGSMGELYEEFMEYITRCAEEVASTK